LILQIQFGTFKSYIILPLFPQKVGEESVEIASVTNVWVRFHLWINSSKCKHTAHDQPTTKLLSVDKNEFRTKCIPDSTHFIEFDFLI